MHSIHLRPLAERERASYFLQLGDFIEYKTPGKENQWHEKIAAFDAARSFTGDIPKFFVVPANDILMSSAKPQTAWEDVVTAVSKSARLNQATFMRIGSLQEVGKEEDIVPRPFAEDRVYDLRPGRVYRLNFSLFESGTQQARPEAVAV